MLNKFLTATIAATALVASPLLAEERAATSQLPAALQQMSLNPQSIATVDEAKQVRGSSAKLKTEFKVWFHGYLYRDGKPLVVSGMAGGQKVSLLATHGHFEAAAHGTAVVGPHSGTQGIIWSNSHAFHGVVGLKGNLNGAHIILLPNAFGAHFH